MRSPIAGRPSRPRRRFPVLLADKGYDSRAFRQACRGRGTDPVIPHRGTHGIKGLGKLRYVVEQSFALLHQFRRLAVRWGRRLDNHVAFVSLGCALICWRRLIKWMSERSCWELLDVRMARAVPTTERQVWSTSNAAFSGSTINPATPWAAGAVSLTDDDIGVAMFNATNMTPARLNLEILLAGQSGFVGRTVWICGRSGCGYVHRFH
jgi:transposase